MGKILHLGGAKGVGKTTLLEQLNDTVTSERNRLGVVHMSQLLNNIALRSYGRELGQLDNIEKKSLRVSTAEHVTMIPRDVVLLDSHCVDMRGDKAECIIPREFERVIDGYAVLTAPPREILVRRKKDAGCRKRDLHLPNIEREVQFELHFATQLAEKNGNQVFVVENLEISEAMRNILAEVDRFMNGSYGKEGGFGTNNEGRFHNIERF